MTKPAGPSRDLITATAVEYRAARRNDIAPRDDSALATIFAHDAHLSFIVERLFEVHRHTVGAEVALGVEDFELAHAALGRLVMEVRMLAASWNCLRRGRGPK